MCQLITVLLLLCVHYIDVIGSAHINDIKHTIDHIIDSSQLTQPRSTVNGLIQGYITSDNTVESYLGIPFAQPPINTNRFKPPQPLSVWNNIKQTIHIPSACPQLRINNELYYGNEDCLYLNVYTPHNCTSNELLPVLVFLYGGAFVLGDSYSLGLYSGEQLVKLHNIIVVTLNYRLGALGFLALDELGAESDNPSHSIGNMAMLDQITALQWIQSNIHSFNGDPARVTLAGESAGAFSVCFHLASPLSAGLFSSAIMESGSCDATSFFLDKEQSIQHSHHIAKRVGCDVSSEKLLDCLRSVDVDILLDYGDDDKSHHDKQTIALMRLVSKLGDGIVPNHNYLSFHHIAPWLTTTTATQHYFGPTVDHVVLHDIPLHVIKSGKFNAVPMLAGYNKDEGSLFVCTPIM